MACRIHPAIEDNDDALPASLILNAALALAQDVEPVTPTRSSAAPADGTTLTLTGRRHGRGGTRVRDTTAVSVSGSGRIWHADGTRGCGPPYSYGRSAPLRPLGGSRIFRRLRSRVDDSALQLHARADLRLTVKGGPKLDQSGGGKLDHPAARWRV